MNNKFNLIMTYKEAQETNVFVIEDNEIKEINLCEHIFESIDETTTPRGVAPREFIETIEVEENEDYYLWDLGGYYSAEELEKIGITELYVISTWGCTGNRYSQGDSFSSDLDEIEEVYFNRVYEFDFLEDDQRNTMYYHSIEEAKEQLVKQ